MSNVELRIVQVLLVLFLLSISRSTNVFTLIVRTMTLGTALAFIIMIFLSN